MGLVYIAGYVLMKAQTLEAFLGENDTNEEFEKYGDLIKEENRGGLTIPRDRIVYFTYYCYIAFYLQQEREPTCQKNYVNFFYQMNNCLSLIPMETTKICRTLSNIFLNNWCKKKNENMRNTNTDLIKRAKLSV